MDRSAFRSHLRRWAHLALLGQLLACSGGDAGGTGPADTEPVTLALSAATLLVGDGQSRTLTVNVTREGKGTSPVTLGVQNLPAGVTATFEPASVTGHTASSTLTVAAAPDAPGSVADVFLAITSPGAASNGVPPSFHLQVAKPQISVARAGAGSGTVTSTPAGVNCGGSCSASFNASPVTLTAAAAPGSTFTGWSGSCTGTAATCTLTPVPLQQNIVTATFTAPGFTLGVAPAPLSLAQGTSATTQVSVTRAGGFTGPVSLAAGSLPTGLNITPNPANVTGDTQTLTVTAALSLPAGSYPIPITAAGTGVPQRTATLTVQVTPAAGGSGNLAFSFAACDPSQVPIWLAVQNGNGAWTRVPASGTTFAFNIGASGGIAYVTRDGPGYRTAVLYLGAAEATALATGSICGSNPQPGSGSLTTNVQSSGTQQVTVTMGAADTTFSDPAPPTGGIRFTLNFVPGGQRDLIAARVQTNTTNGFPQFQRMVLRRDVRYRQNATPPPLDFNGAESFAPLPQFVVVNNLAGDQGSVSESFITTNGASAAFFETPGNFAPNFGYDVVRYGAVPDSLLRPADLHALLITALPAGSNPTGIRFVNLLLHGNATGNQPAATVTLGPPLATPTVTTLGTTPYLRMRVRFASQAAYGAAGLAYFEQGGNSFSLASTAAYSAGAPADWTLDVPDLSGAGYDAAWGLRSGAPVEWLAGALGGNILPFNGGTLVDGAQMPGAYATGSPITAGNSAWRKPLRLRLPGRAP